MVKGIDMGAVLDYAKRWAYGRNPYYHSFDGLGGDCTNFISQCLRAGGAAMNFTPDTGWYYLGLNDRAAAWTGVEFFYRFMMTNMGRGPFGCEVEQEDAEAGDIIQLGNSSLFYHTLIAVAAEGGEIYAAAHTTDVYGVPLSSYSYQRARFLRIREYRE
ncbi:MAG: amidase domain-containing protein [Ruminococcus sp.]|nr:amidase domain-containing protein [Ruminococcus sp.]